MADGGLRRRRLQRGRGEKGIGEVGELRFQAEIEAHEGRGGWDRGREVAVGASTGEATGAGAGGGCGGAARG